MNKIMKFKKWVKHYVLGESLKEIELNRILDKISSGNNITEREKKYLDLYNTTSYDDQDFVYLSKNTTHKKIEDLLEKGKTIYCDLQDRDGIIGRKITNIKNNFEDDTSLVIMDNGEIHKLHDRYLYNIIYNTKKDQYSLQAQDEYFERIPVKEDEN